MLLLNHSLADVGEIKARMASMGSEIDQYDAQLRNINQKFGDLQLSHKELSSGIDQLKSDVAGIKVHVAFLLLGRYMCIPFKPGGTM